MLEILGSNYQTKDKGQHIATKVDAKIKGLVLQKSSQKNYFCPSNSSSSTAVGKYFIPLC